METIAKEFMCVNKENELKLSDEQIRIVVWLDAGYTQAEIAESLGCNQATVSRKCTQIKRKCKNLNEMCIK